MRYDSKLFSTLVSLHSIIHKKIFQFLSSLSLKLYRQYADNSLQSHRICARFLVSIRVAGWPWLNIYPASVHQSRADGAFSWGF